MITNLRRLVRPLLPLALVALALASLPPMPAQAVSDKWSAWHVQVAFPNNQLEVRYTSYQGTDNPVEIDPNSISELDLTPNCLVNGPLPISNEVASFNGATAIRCLLPATSGWAATCPVGKGPLFAASDMVLDPVNGNNPVFSVPGRSLYYSLPRSGANVRTQLRLGANTYTTPNWVAQSAGNQMVIGANGPTVTEVANYFSWLSFLPDPQWQSYFNANVKNANIGHWIEPYNTGWTTPASSYTMSSASSYLYIGYNPNTGSYLRGDLRIAEVDPGCVGG